MSSLFEIGLTNAAIATLLAALVWLVARIWRQPAFVHALWVLVLVKLVTPPLVGLPWPQLTAATAALEPAESPREFSNDAIPEAAPTTPTIAAPITAVAAPVIPAEPDALEPAAIVSPPAPAAFVDLVDTQPAIIAPIPASESAADGSGAPPENPLQAGIDYAPLWPTAAIAIWLAGSAAWLVITIMRLARFHRALAGTSPATDVVRHWADAVAARLGVSRTYRLRITEGRLSPLVWPIGRPTIVLPRSLVSELTREEIEMLLTHEFAHLRRKDHWVRWLELVVTALYWWLPLVWWARRQIRRAEERACDAWVVGAFPQAAGHYAEALFKAVECALSHRPAAPMVASQLSAGRDLQERIENIMNASWKDRLSWPVRLAVLLLGLMILPFSLGAAQPADESPQAAAEQPTKESMREVGSTPNSGAPQPLLADQALDKYGPDDEIQPGMMLKVIVSDVPADRPIQTYLLVDKTGHIDLGPAYGKVEVDGMKVGWAEIAIVDHLKSTLPDPHVLVSIAQRPDQPGRVDGPDSEVPPAQASRWQIEALKKAQAGEITPSTQIVPGMKLLLDVVGDLPEGQIQPYLVVDLHGYIDLAVPQGRVYCRMKVDGLSTPRVSTDITNALRQFNPAAKARVAIVPVNGLPGLATKPAVEQDRSQVVKPGTVLRFAYVTDAGAEEIITGTVDEQLSVTLVGASGTPIGRLHVANLSIAQAEAAISKKLQGSIDNRRWAATTMRTSGPPQVETSNEITQKIRPGMALIIRVLGVRPDQPINDAFAVDPQGEIDLGPSYGRVSVSGWTVVEASTAIKEHLRAKFPEAKVQVNVVVEQKEADAAAEPSGTPQEKIHSGMSLRLQITAKQMGDQHDSEQTVSLPVGADGQIDLGGYYGRVAVKDLTFAEAEAAVKAKLSAKANAENGNVSITKVSITAPSTIAPGDIIFVWVRGTSPEYPIRDNFIVEPSGQVKLGVIYGRVKVAGLTFDDAEKEINESLRKQNFKDPQTMVTVGGWQNAVQGAANPVAARPGWQQRLTTTAPSRKIESDDTVLVHIQTAGRPSTINAVKVDVEGFIDLGSPYGKMKVVGLTTEESKNLIRRQLPPKIGDAEVIVELDKGSRAGTEVYRRGATDPNSAPPTTPWEAAADRTREPLPSAAPVATTESLGVLKRIIVLKQRELAIVKSRADAGVLQPGEDVEMKKAELEISMARLNQTERAVETRRMELSQLQAEYEDAVKLNEQTPGALPAAELRRMKYAIEIAKLKLDEIAN